MKKENVNNMTWEELIKACNNLGADDNLDTINAKALMIEAYIARTLNTGDKAAHNAFAVNDKNVNAAGFWLSELAAKSYNIVAAEKGVAPIQKL